MNQNYLARLNNLEKFLSFVEKARLYAALRNLQKSINYGQKAIDLCLIADGTKYGHRTKSNQFELSCQILGKMEHSGGEILNSSGLRAGRDTLRKALSLVDNSFDSLPLDRQARLLKELIL